MPHLPSYATPCPHSHSTYAGVAHWWQRRGWLATALLPLAGVYGVLQWLHKSVYHLGLRASEHAGVPTIVIGNVIAGGAGKTPVTIATVAHLQSRGWKVGVISRGYGRSGADKHKCCAVLPDSQAQAVGDEPLLIARRTGVPVFVSPQRVQAARALLAAHPDTQVIVCDDGLQHWALRSDVQVCVFNNAGIGNGWLLPAGPLREPWPRSVSAVVYAQDEPVESAQCPHELARAAAPTFALRRTLADEAVDAAGQRVRLDVLMSMQRPIHAVAGTARPQEFFQMLRDKGLELAHTHALPDHADFSHWSEAAAAQATLLCTQKDAVKLWAHCPQALAVGLEVEIDNGYFTLLDAALHTMRKS